MIAKLAAAGAEFMLGMACLVMLAACGLPPHRDTKRLGDWPAWS